MRLAILAAVLFLLGANVAAAASWRVEPGLVPQATSDRLAERYGDLKSPVDLENLLRDIGRRHPMTRLEAHLQAGVWVITGKRAVPVTDIDVAMITRLLQNPLRTSVQGYIGQVDSPELRDKVKAVILKYMKRRGYPEASVTFAAEDTDDGLVYRVKVNEGDPCVIDRIELGFKLPPGIRLEVGPGDICDLEELETATNELELALRDRGYNQLKLDLGDLNYDSEHDTAIVYIAGVLGQRVRYEIVDTSKRFLIDDLFADEELTKVDPTIVGPDAMKAELERRYRNRGFIDVQVRGPEVKKAGEDEFVYVYNVDPGKQYILKSVQFEGVTVFKEEEVLDTMGLKSLWQTARPVNYEELQTGLTALRGRYQAAGYWDAKVRDPGLGQRDKEAGTVRLTISVEEGIQRVLNDVRTDGNTAITNAEIRDMLAVPSGAPLDRAKLVDFQQAVRTAYIARGYLYAEVQVDLKAQEQKKQLLVDVIVKVTEGIRVKVGDITVVGLARTHEKVVRRELLIQRGDWYDPEKIMLSRQALTRLGLFRSVQIVPADRNAVAEREREIDLVVEVQEGKAGNVSFGPGWSLAKGWNYGAEASYSNIGGVGRQASVRGAISEEKDQAAIGNKTLVGRKIGAGYLEPYVFDWPVDASISANQKAEWGGDLWELSYGGELALIYRLRLLLPNSSVSWFYGQKVARTEGSSQKEEEQLASDVRIGQTGTRFNLDRRDNLKFPTDGYTLDTELAWARYGLGGDLKYFRWDVGTSVYFGILDDLVLAFNVGLTSYEGVERKGEQVGILPPSERLSSGGADTVRGYRPRSLGPVVRSPTLKDTADGNCDISYTTSPLDGTSRTTIKTELRYKINETLATTGFMDNGNVFLSGDQMRKAQAAYEDPADTSSLAENSPCKNLELKRHIEDNFSYDYIDLLTKPGYVWSRHYFAYGVSINLLTALGSVNFAYGLPWREPVSVECSEDDSKCNPRAKQSGHWLTRGEFHLNVGARF